MEIYQFAFTRSRNFIIILSFLTGICQSATDAEAMDEGYDATECLLKTGDRVRSPDGKRDGESAFSSIPMAELTSTPAGRLRVAVGVVSALEDAKGEESEAGSFHDETVILNVAISPDLLGDLDRSAAEDAVNKYHRLINFLNSSKKSKRITELKSEGILSGSIEAETAAIAVLAGQAGDVAKRQVLNYYFKAVNKLSSARRAALVDMHLRAKDREAELLVKNNELKRRNAVLQRQYDEVSQAHAACVRPVADVVLEVADDDTAVAPKTTTVKQRNRCTTYAVVIGAVSNVAWLIAFLYAKNVIKF